MWFSYRNALSCINVQSTFPITRILANSNLPLTRTSFNFPRRFELSSYRESTVHVEDDLKGKENWFELAPEDSSYGESTVFSLFFVVLTFSEKIRCYGPLLINNLPQPLISIYSIVSSYLY